MATHTFLITRGKIANGQLWMTLDGAPGDTGGNDEYVNCNDTIIWKVADNAQVIQSIVEIGKESVDGNMNVFSSPPTNTDNTYRTFSGTIGSITGTETYYIKWKAQDGTTHIFDPRLRVRA